MTAIDTWVPAVRAERRRAPVLGLLTANAISLTGSALTALAVPWFVLETTGSATRTGISAFFTVLPLVLASFVGGAVVDRVGARRMSVMADVASGVTVATIPLLYHTVGLAFWQLLLLVFFRALLDAPGSTARGVLLPDLAAAGRMPLERANAATQAIGRGARLVGAPLAGLLVTAAGASAALWIDAATFAVSAALIGVLIPGTATAAPSEGGFRGHLAGGLRFIRRNRLLLALVALVAIANFLDAPLAVALPVYAKQRFDSAAALGLMLGASAGGAVVGAVVFGAIGGRLPWRPVFVGGFILSGMLYGILPVGPPLPVVIAAFALGGFGAGPLNPVLSTVFQERVPAELRGRVFGVVGSLAMIATPVGVVAGGWLIEQAGLRPFLLGLAAAYLAVTLSMVFVPALRDLDAGR